MEPCYYPPYYSLLISVNEPTTLKYFMKFAKDGGIVVDVGANVGIYSLIAAKYAEKVFAIEPNPELIDAIRKNVELNGFKNVIIVNKAINDSEEKVRLYLSKVREVSSIVPSIMKEYKYDKYIEVEATTLDKLLFDVNSINLIKIDVEGAEVNVLRGASETLKKTKRIIVEVRKDYTEEQALEMLKKNNFKIDKEEIFGNTKNIIAEKRL
ncbi:FkbM family methyltransferase [Sulfolobus sp. E11-6]|uniref:FkbM family methyltransferase n=1 Tax=Sulfolobus sp. E11-6 TaxID=2663020 RepID=UPI0013868882|nr:FkbM family methyltransferase [Sulfolobus sp. E11-6]